MFCMKLKDFRMLLTTEQIKAALQDRNLSAVARNADVSLFTLKNIQYGKHAPRYHTLEKLSKYLTTPAWERANTVE